MVVMGGVKMIALQPRAVFFNLLKQVSRQPALPVPVGTGTGSLVADLPVPRGEC